MSIKNTDIVSIKRSGRRNSSKRKAKDIHNEKGCKSSTMERQVIQEPHDHDVLCGRGGKIASHFGNKTFRNWVKEQKEIYNLASNKHEKAAISEQIVKRVKALEPSGRFLIKEKIGSTETAWVEINLNRALAKTCQALREGAPILRAQIRAKAKQSDGMTKSKSTSNKRKRNRYTNGRCTQSKEVNILSTDINTSKSEQLHMKKDTTPIIRCIGGSHRGKVLIPSPSQEQRETPVKKQPFDSDDNSDSPPAKQFCKIQDSSSHLEKQKITLEVPKVSPEKTEITMEKMTIPSLMECKNTALSTKLQAHITYARSHSLATSEMSGFDENETFQNPFEDDGANMDTNMDANIMIVNEKSSIVDAQLAPDATISTTGISHIQSTDSIKSRYNIFESFGNVVFETPNRANETHNTGEMGVLKNIHSR